MILSLIKVLRGYRLVRRGGLGHTKQSFGDVSDGWYGHIEDTFAEFHCCSGRHIVRTLDRHSRKSHLMVTLFGHVIRAKSMPDRCLQSFYKVLQHLFLFIYMCGQLKRQLQLYSNMYWCTLYIFRLENILSNNILYQSSLNFSSKNLQLV